VFLPKLDDRREFRGGVDRLTKLTMNAVDYVRMIERTKRMMIKKRPPADPLLRRSNRAELRRPLSTLGRLYKVFAYCVLYLAFFRITWAVSASWK
jgi:hypothetical protein